MTDLIFDNIPPKNLKKILDFKPYNRITFIQKRVEDTIIEIIFKNENIKELEFFITLHKRQFKLLIYYLIHNFTLEIVQVSYPNIINHLYIRQLKYKIIKNNIFLEKFKIGNEEIEIKENKRIKELFSYFEREYTFPIHSFEKNENNEVILLKNRNIKSLLLLKDIYLPTEIINEIFSYIPSIKFKTLLVPFLSWLFIYYPYEKEIILKIKRKVMSLKKKSFYSRFLTFSYGKGRKD